MFPTEQGAQGAAVFDFDLPCDDTWHIWVKGLDRGTNDSFFADVDGNPNPAAIFDLDCEAQDPEDAEYIWAHLNSREGDSQCGVGNDWVINAGPGEGVVSFYEREVGAISAVAISNDPGYTPNF